MVPGSRKVPSNHRPAEAGEDLKSVRYKRVKLGVDDLGRGARAGGVRAHDGAIGVGGLVKHRGPRLSQSLLKGTAANGTWGTRENGCELGGAS